MSRISNSALTAIAAPARSAGVRRLFRCSMGVALAAALGCSAGVKATPTGAAVAAAARPPSTRALIGRR